MVSPMTMRVLHVAEVLPGGTASYLQEIYADQVNSLGPDNVRFLLPVCELEHTPTIPQNNIFAWHRHGRNPVSLYKLAIAIRKAVEIFRPDIVHLHGTFAGVSGRIVLSLKPMRPKIIYCAHGWPFAMEVSPRKKSLYGFIEKLLARVCDSIIAISDDERKRALSAGLPQRKLKTILNGIEESCDIAHADRIEHGPVRIVFAGRHDHQKGLDILLDAMKEISEEEVQLDILGAPLDDTGRRRMLPQKASQPGIRYLGWVNRKDVFRHIAEADALVMPSRWEGFGIVAIEALRAGTPVIASDRGGLPEVVTDSVTGFVIKPDPHALARCLKNLKREKLRSMGIAAKADFTQRFTSSRMCREILEVYRDVLSPKSEAVEIAIYGDRNENRLYRSISTKSHAQRNS